MQPFGLISAADRTTHIETWSPEECFDECGLPRSIGASERNADSAHFNAMINPFKVLTVKGIVWYQGWEKYFGLLFIAISSKSFLILGESNYIFNADHYDCALGALINSYRSLWSHNSGSQLSIPFGIVQIGTKGWSGKDNRFSALRWRQTSGLGIMPNEHREVQPRKYCTGNG